MKQIQTITLNLPKTYVQSSYCNPENNFKPKIWNKLLASVHLMQCQYFVILHTCKSHLQLKNMVKLCLCLLKHHTKSTGSSQLHAPVTYVPVCYRSHRTPKPHRNDYKQTTIFWTRLRPVK